MGVFPFNSQCTWLFISGDSMFWFYRCYDSNLVLKYRDFLFRPKLFLYQDYAISNFDFTNPRFVMGSLFQSFAFEPHCFFLFRGLSHYIVLYCKFYLVIYCSDRFSFLYFVLCRVPVYGFAVIFSHVLTSYVHEGTQIVCTVSTYQAL